MEGTIKLDVVLASASPRRKELMVRVTPDFTVAPTDVDERALTETDPVKFAVAAAALKARRGGESFPDALVIGADTVVALDRAILGKPEDAPGARRMLRMLSGTRHKVITGLALYHKNEDKLLTDYDLTYVTFHELTDEQIEAYIASGDFADKAGSYSVQQVGDIFVKKIQGDYDNVVGFPVRKVRRLMTRFQAPEIAVEAVDMALPNNWTVTRHDKLVIFVPGPVVGDRLRVRVTKESKNFSYGEIARVEEPSPFRVEPACPHFGVCGGCIMQNLAYPKQCEVKRNYLFKTLEKIGGVDVSQVEAFPLTPSPDVYHYRNKMEYAFGERDGALILGLRERATPLKKFNARTVPLTGCPIFSPVVEKIFPVVLDYARNHGLVPYHPMTRQGFLRHLVLREGKLTGQLMALLVTTGGGLPEPERLTERMRAALPSLKSLYHVVNNQISDVVNMETKNLLWGEPAIEEQVGDLYLKVYPETFLQPNSRAAALLYAAIATEAAGRGAHSALGLYCGAGAIELGLARNLTEVTGIDISPINITTARENCARNQLTNCRFLEGPVERMLKEEPKGNADLLIIDPPRAGITGKGLSLIASLGIRTIAYVSCNPATLARDLQFLREHGYRVASVRPYDLFPHTAHLETLVILTSERG